MKILWNLVKIVLYIKMVEAKKINNNQTLFENFGWFPALFLESRGIQCIKQNV
jgi:hypothetical protein